MEVNKIPSIKFLERLVEIRKSNDLSYKELEKLTGISAIKLSKFEKETSSLRLNDIETLAKHFHVSMRWFIGEEDE